MGYTVARAALGRGDRVALVSGPAALVPPRGCEFVGVWSARDMYEEVLARYEATDVVVMAAAVADFRPKARSGEKIRKSLGGLALDLEPTEDILAELGRRKAGQTLVGFALETAGEGKAAPQEDLTAAMRERASRKLTEKNLDLVLLNAPGALDAEASAVSALLRGGGWQDWGTASKEEHAARLVALAAELARSG